MSTEEYSEMNNNVKKSLMVDTVIDTDHQKNGFNYKKCIGISVGVTAAVIVVGAIVIAIAILNKPKLTNPVDPGVVGGACNNTADKA